MNFHFRNFKQYLTVTDQIAISASAFGTSAAVVKISGVDQLGLYTALLTAATLIQSGFGSLVSGQLLLFISGKTPRFASVYFKLSYQMWFVFALGLSLLTFITVYIFGYLGFSIDSRLLIWTLLFVIAMTSFEQNRRYFYATSNFEKSFLSTITFLFLHALISSLLFWKTNQYTAKHAFTSLGIAYLVVSLTNPFILKIIFSDQSEKRLGAFRVFKKFFLQGKFAFLGLFTAWVQNQSMPIFLLAVFGPTQAGFFALGRLLLMPVLVINLGLSNGLLPKFRKFASQSLLKELNQQTRFYSISALAVVIAYSMIVFTLMKFNVLAKILPELDAAENYIYLWFALAAIISFRTWITLFFIAQVQFKLLLKIGLISAVFTVLGVLIFTALFQSALMATSVIFLGEVVYLILLIKHKSKTDPTHCC